MELKMECFFVAYCTYMYMYIHIHFCHPSANLLLVDILSWDHEWSGEGWPESCLLHGQAGHQARVAVGWDSSHTAS